MALLLGSGLARIIYPLHTVYKANRYGKAKMVLQGLGLSLILIDAIFKLTIFNWIATVILILAIISGVISFFKYAQNIIKTGNKN